MRKQILMKKKKKKHDSAPAVPSVPAHDARPPMSRRHKMRRYETSDASSTSLAQRQEGGLPESAMRKEL